MPIQILVKYLRPILFLLQNISILIGILYKVLFFIEKMIDFKYEFSNCFWFQMDALC